MTQNKLQQPEGKPSVARILIGLPFPISRGKIQFFCVEILCGKWEMRSEHSTSSFLISYFSFLTSHIPYIISCISLPTVSFYCHLTS